MSDKQITTQDIPYANEPRTPANPGPTSIEEEKQMTSSDIPGVTAPKVPESEPKLKAIVVDDQVAKLFSERKIKAFLKNKLGEVYGELYVCGSSKVYGIIALNRPIKVTKERAKISLEATGLSSEEVETRFPSDKFLYYYTFKIVDIFKNPKEYEKPPATMDFLQEVNFKKSIINIESKIINVNSIKEISNKEMEEMSNKIFKDIPFEFETNAILKSDKTGDWIVEGYASTDCVDRQDEIISMEALIKAKDDLLKNNTVFYEHKHDEFPIGKVISSEIDDTGLKIKVQISQTAGKIWKLITEGVLHAFSIGGRVIKATEKYLKEQGLKVTEIQEIELFEVSLVGIPANPQAQTIDWYISKALYGGDKKVMEKVEEKALTTQDIPGVVPEKIEEPKKVEEKVEEKVEVKVETKVEEIKVEEVKKEEEVVVEKIKEVEKVAEVKVEEIKQEKVDEPICPVCGHPEHGEEICPLCEDDKACGKPKEEKAEIIVAPVEEIPVEEVPVEEIPKEEEIISKPEPDVTENYIRIRQRDPEDFVEGSFRTIDLSVDEGIKAVIGNLKTDPEGPTVIQTYLFDKEKWTVERAQTWADEHKTCEPEKEKETILKSVIAYQDFPIAPLDTEWDSTKADLRVREYAGGTSIDWEKYGKAFMYYDSSKSEIFGSYKLQYADVIDNELKVVAKAISSIVGVLHGARGGVDIPQTEQDTIMNQCEKYQEKIDEMRETEKLVQLLNEIFSTREKKLDEMNILITKLSEQITEVQKSLKELDGKTITKTEEIPTTLIESKIVEVEKKLEIKKEEIPIVEKIVEVEVEKVVEKIPETKAIVVPSPYEVPEGKEKITEEEKAKNWSNFIWRKR